MSRGDVTLELSPLLHLPLAPLTNGRIVSLTDAAHILSTADASKNMQTVSHKHSLVSQSAAGRGARGALLTSIPACVHNSNSSLVLEFSLMWSATLNLNTKDLGYSALGSVDFKLEFRVSLIIFHSNLITEILFWFDLIYLLNLLIY